MKNTMTLSRKHLWSITGLLLLSTPLFVAAAGVVPRTTVAVPSSKCTDGSPAITIDWTDVIGAKHYSVFENTKPSPIWKNISSKSSNSVFIDKNVTPGITYQYQVKTYFSSSTSASYSNIVTIKAAKCTVTVTPSTNLPPTSGEIPFEAFVTGYGWPDNTPASANISNGVIHTKAGGVGTYSDPITIAVGHSILSGKDILDYTEGTRFYIPALRKYFIVEDTCGDGNTPQNGPCHSGYQGKVWLDVWVGGQGAAASSVYACEDKITDFHTVIQNPASNYSVISGPVFNGTCATLYGETPVSN